MTEVKSSFNLPGRPNQSLAKPPGQVPLNPYFERILQAKEAAAMAKAANEAFADGEQRPAPEPGARLDVGTILVNSINQANESHKSMLAMLEKSQQAVTAEQRSRLESMERQYAAALEQARQPQQNGNAVLTQIETFKAYREAMIGFSREMTPPAPAPDGQVSVLLKKLDVDLSIRQSELSMKLEEMKDARLEREKQFEFEKHKWEQERQDAKGRHDEEMALKRQQMVQESRQKAQQQETIGVFAKAVGATLEETMGGASDVNGAAPAMRETAARQEPAAAVVEEEVTLPCKHQQLVRSDATTVTCNTCKAEYAASPA